MSKHIIELKNQKKIVLEQVKCPICNSNMDIENSIESGHIVERLIPPYNPFFSEWKKEYDIERVFTLVCHNSCCKIEIEGFYYAFEEN